MPPPPSLLARDVGIYQTKPRPHPSRSLLTNPLPTSSPSSSQPPRTYSPTIQHTMDPSVTLAEELSIHQTGPNQYTSVHKPQNYGTSPTNATAYGGTTIGLATAAAHQTIPSQSYTLYSLVGQFLGPATTAFPLHFTVHPVRTTKTFATRRVVVSQQQPDGSVRDVLHLLADFHVAEETTLRYSAPPSRTYSGPTESHTLYELVTRALNKADVQPPARLKENRLTRHLEWRVCPEGFARQTIEGWLPHLPTTQDHLPVTDRASAEWVKVADREAGSLKTAAEKAAAHAFFMDSLPWTAVVHNKIAAGEVVHSATIDFALRVFVPEVNLGDGGWYLREKKAVVAGVGRSYVEGRLWDEKGNLVSSMTQQAILRLKEGTEKTKAVL